MESNHNPSIAGYFSVDYDWPVNKHSYHPFVDGISPAWKKGRSLGLLTTNHLHFVGWSSKYGWGGHSVESKNHEHIQMYDE